MHQSRTSARQTAVLVAVALLTAAGPVTAANYAGATLSKFAIKLYDLDPSDGVAPSITFAADPVAGANVVRGSAEYTATGQESTFSEMGAQFFSPVSGSASVAYAVSSASISGPGRPDGGNTTFTASGTAEGARSHDDGDPFSVFSAAAQADVRFVLSANTMVSVMARLDLVAYTTVGLDVFKNREESFAEGVLQVGQPPEAGGTVDSDGRGFYANKWNGGPEYKSLSVPLLVSWSNSSASSFDGVMYVTARAAGWSEVALDHHAVGVVPEPGTCGLMLAGLGLVCWRRPGSRGARRATGSAGVR
jgi:hypothetical protein